MGQRMCGIAAQTIAGKQRAEICRIRPRVVQDDGGTTGLPLEGKCDEITQTGCWQRYRRI